MKKILNLIVLVFLLVGFAFHTSCSKEEKIFLRISNQPTGIPVITTSFMLESITATSVIAEANITSEGASFVIETGFEISNDGHWYKCKNLYWRSSGTGKFTQEISGLWPGKIYGVRAYATNSAGTAYGNIWDFTTLTKPVVTTDLVTVLSQTAATIFGSVTKICSADIVERGVCYGTAPAPTTEELRAVVPTNAVGTFTCNLQNLIPGTHYYARAYVSIYSDDGWLNFVPFYGNEVTFTAGDP